MTEHIPDCKYFPNRSAVACEDQTKCDKCGWNPKVDMERKQKNREKRADMLRKGVA